MVSARGSWCSVGTVAMPAFPSGSSAGTVAGSSGFPAFFAYELDLFRPGPDLRKLFIAIGTIALVGSCVSFRRALSLHSAGPVTRLSNLFFGLSALGFVLLFVFIASATAPVEGRHPGALQNHGGGG